MHDLQRETKIIKWIILLPIFAVIVTSIILINIFVSSRYEIFNSEVKTLEQKHIASVKEKTKERIEHISFLLNTNYNNQIQDSKITIKNIIYMGHSMLEEIYENNKHLPKKEIYKIINEKMKDVRFFKDRSGYFFIWDLNDGTSISLPSAPKLIGTSLVNLVDKKGKRLFDSYANILDTKGEGFDQWFWYKPNSKVMQEKIGYMKKFEALNIGIGTAVYLDDIKEDISLKSIEFIKQLKYSDNSYVFILDSKGTSILHRSKNIQNIPLENLDFTVQANVNDILIKATSSDGSFIEYSQSDNLFKDFKLSKKISYVKHIPILDWVIGTGIYTDDLNKQIELKEKDLEKRLDQDIQKLLLVSFIVSVVIIGFLLVISRRIKSIIEFYSSRLNESNLELKKLNHDLEEKVNTQVHDIRQKDLILNQQSKLAAMGEMLGNIAHQWRQPLSAISIVASGLKVKNSMEGVPPKQLDSDLGNIVETTKVLSNTIDDFSNFYSNKKELSQFNLKDTVAQVLNLVLPNLKNNNIEIINDIDNVFITSYKNELIQALLNIINNSKDVLLDIDSNRYIFITIKKVKEFAVIEVLDNGGGIKKKVIERVFEPYFTTKFKSQGTGIGLYMTKKIVESSLNGRIEVFNKKFNMENEKYKGAMFKITLPVK